MRMSRRAGLYGGQAIPSIELFWSNTVLESVATDSHSSQSSSTLTLGDTTSPLWVFYTTGKAIRIDKYKQNVQTPLQLVTASSSVTATLNITSDSTTAATKVKTGNVNGFVLMAFSCPNYQENTVDKVLQEMNLTIITSYSATSAASVYTSSSDINSTRLYIQAIAAAASGSTAGCWSICNGSTPSTAIKRIGANTGTNPYWYLSGNGSYYLSRTGDSVTTTRAGGIYEVY